MNAWTLALAIIVALYVLWVWLAVWATKQVWRSIKTKTVSAKLIVAAVLLVFLVYQAAGK